MATAVVATSDAAWPLVRLGDAVTVVNGGTPRSKVAEYWGGEHQWLTPADMGKMAGRKIGATPRTITSEGLAKSSARLVPPNSVILSTRAPIGHLAINEVPMAFNQGCRGLVPSKDVDHLFLYYFLMANRNLLDDLGSGTTFKELSATNLKSVSMPLPSLEEQKRIVAVLDKAFAALDRARANAEDNLADAKEFLSSFVEAELQRSGGEVLSLQDMLDGGLILSHLDGNHGSNYPRKEEFVDAGVPYVSANCIIDDQIDLGKAKFLTPARAATINKGVACDGDVIFAHNATVGPVALLETDEEKVILSTSVTFYRPDTSRILPQFLMYEMRSAAFRRQYEAVMRQATRNQVPITAQRKLTHTIPDLGSQAKLVSACSALESHSRELNKSYSRQLHDLNDLRQSILQRAFAGELS